MQNHHCGPNVGHHWFRPSYTMAAVHHGRTSPKIIVSGVSSQDWHECQWHFLYVCMYILSVPVLDASIRMLVDRYRSVKVWDTEYVKSNTTRHILTGTARARVSWSTYVCWYCSQVNTGSQIMHSAIPDVAECVLFDELEVWPHYSCASKAPLALDPVQNPIQRSAGLQMYPWTCSNLPSRATTAVPTNNSPSVGWPVSSTCAIHMDKVMYGDRTFERAGPSLWNKLPIHLRSQQKLSTFKKHLKTHMFTVAYSEHH